VVAIRPRRTRQSAVAHEPASRKAGGRNVAGVARPKLTLFSELLRMIAAVDVGCVGGSTVW
jgi:hypothetical protein